MVVEKFAAENIAIFSRKWELKSATSRLVIWSIAPAAERRPPAVFIDEFDPTEEKLVQKTAADRKYGLTPDYESNQVIR